MSEDPSKTSAADVQLLTVECAAAYSEICDADAQIRTAVFFMQFCFGSMECRFFL